MPRVRPKQLAVLFIIVSLIVFTLSIITYHLYCWNSFKRGLEEYRQLGAAYRQSSASSGGVFMPILMPVCGRRDFLRQALRQLQHCADINKTVLITSDDCPSKRGLDVFREFSLPFPIIHLSHIRPYLSIPSLVVNNEYATTANVYFLLQFAFDHLEAPAAITLESDLVPSKDMFLYFQWAFQHFMIPDKEIQHQQRGNILSINGYGRLSTPQSDPFELHYDRFMVWGWMTSSYRWRNNLRDNWARFNNWDFTIDEIRRRSNLYCLTPALSRIKNVGYFGENFSLSESRFLTSDYNKVYIDNRTIRQFNVIPRIT